MIVTLALFACAPTEPAAPPEPPKPVYSQTDEALRGIFKPLPASMETPDRPVTAERVALGRVLYFDTRFSKNQDLSCNSCHGLETYGVDNQPTSPGHKGQRGGRNSPTVYNAGLHVAQFWDGRAADLEAQAKGPVLNPIEMAMAGEEAVLAVVKSVPGYAEPFAKAFPGQPDPITYDNMATAIGAFERTLVTPARFDKWLAGDNAALTPEERAGLDLFVATGCSTCHSGAAVGGGMYMKLGLVEPYETADVGRFEVTKVESDKGVFKVPSLRNIAKTGPYFHDGSIASLDVAVQKMAKHQLGKTLDAAQSKSIVTFLEALTGDLPGPDVIGKPAIPESGPNTPKPDPS